MKPVYLNFMRNFLLSIKYKLINISEKKVLFIKIKIHFFYFHKFF